MRILLLNFEKGWRGGERQTLLSMQEFRKAGHQVDLLARAGSELTQAARDDGFTVFEATGAGGLCMQLWRLRTRFDVFHAQTANTMTWLALLKPWLRGKAVFTRRTAFPVQRREAVTAWKWRQADVLVAITRAAAVEPERLGVPVTHIIPSAVVYQEANPQNVQTLRQRYKIAGRVVLATAAALTREKDPLTLIRAIHALRQQRDDFVFLHFGGGGALQAQAHALVAELGLEQTYIFAGFHGDITDCYRLMDVFVLSSRNEALGSSVLDAFLYGVPVVSTLAGGLAEILADGRGVGCPVGDANCLARGIQTVLDNAQLRSVMVEDAAAYVREHHSAEKMAQSYLAAYGAPISKSTAPGSISR